MENELLVLQNIEQEVAKITKFDQTKEQLVAKVKETQNITAEDLRDQMQLAVVQRNRIDLRAIEIAIEKRGKGYRDIFTSANKQIMAKQNELLAITNPEVERLSAIEEEAKAIRIRDERVALLPNKREKLATIGWGIEIISDEQLLEMDEQTFTEYYNQSLSAKLEVDREKAELKMRKEQEALDAQRQEIEAEKQRLRDITNVVESLKTVEELKSVSVS